MERICSAGILYVCLTAKKIGSEVAVRAINSYSDGFRFYEQCKHILKEKGDVVVFSALGQSHTVRAIRELVVKQVRNNFDRIYDGRKIDDHMECLDELGNEFNCLIQEEIFKAGKLKLPKTYSVTVGDCDVECIWMGEESQNSEYDAITESALRIWLEYEQPFIMGKQIMIRSFQFASLTGRRIVGVFPDGRCQELCLLLDGGRKMCVNDDSLYVREKLDTNEIDVLSLTEIDSMLNNPAYFSGRFFYPQEIYDEWSKVFLYAAGIQSYEWTIEKLEAVYEEFLHFMEVNICKTISAEALIEKDKFYRVLLKNISELKKYLQGNDIPIISKELWLFLNSRYVYLPYIYKLIGKTGNPVVVKRYKPEEMVSRLEMVDVPDHYQKGINWEMAVQYFLEHIEGLKISGHRVKAISEEIDLSVINVSLDYNLWQMGAYILVECKNWKEKIGINIIRNLVHISELKGNKTVFLFITSELTRDAQREIIRSLTEGKYILVFTKTELKGIKSGNDCYQVLLDKWNELEEKMEEIEFM